MATKLFFRATASDWQTGNLDNNLRAAGYYWDARSLALTAGSAKVDVVTATVAGPTPGIEVGTPASSLGYVWYSPPLGAAATISGVITCNIWANESSNSANTAINAVIEKVDGTTGAITAIAQTARTTELGTSKAVQNFTVTPGAGVAMKKGDRLRVRIFGDDSSQNMGTGFTFTVGFDGPTNAADGDTYITFTENLTLASEPAGTTVYPTATPMPGGYRAVVMATAGLKGYWRLGESSGGTAFSQTAWGNGDYIGPVTPIAGAIADGNTGVQATPANCTVAMRDTTNFEFADPDTFSIECWINRQGSTQTGKGCIIAKGSGAYGLRIDQTSGLIEFLRDRQAVLVTSTVGVPLTGWHHIVCTKAGAAVKQWLDKVDVTGTVTNVTFTNSGQFLFFGSDNSANFGGIDPFIGGMDEIAVYTAAMPPADVTAHFDAADDTAFLGPSGVNREAWTSRGAAAVQSIQASAAGPLAPRQWTDTNGGQTVDWHTRPLNAFTLGGAVRVNMRALESDPAANMAVRCEIARESGDGLTATLWAATTVAFELGASEAAQSFLVAGDDLAISDGQRIRIRFMTDDAAGLATAAGWAATLYYGGPTPGASGDTFLRFTQTLTELSFNRTATASLTGGGVITRTSTTDRQRTQAMTGGGVIVSTRKKTGIADPMAFTGGGVITATGVQSVVEVHTGTAALTGGGVVTPIPVRGARASAVASGGGVMTVVRSSSRSRTQALSGGGVVVLARTSARTGTQTLTGGGAVVASRTSARSRSQPLTGGGVIVSTYSVSIVVAKTYAATLTGGGVIALTRAKGGRSTVTATGSGVAVTAQRTDRLRVQPMSGGGTITYAYAAGTSRSGFASLTGGGVVTASRTHAGRATTAATGGGAVSVQSGANRRSGGILTGGGVVVTARLAARRSSLAATGGGVVTMTGVASVPTPTGTARSYAIII